MNVTNKVTVKQKLNLHFRGSDVSWTVFSQVISTSKKNFIMTGLVAIPPLPEHTSQVPLIPYQLSHLSLLC